MQCPGEVGHGLVVAEAALQQFAEARHQLPALAHHRVGGVRQAACQPQQVAEQHLEPAMQRKSIAGIRARKFACEHAHTLRKVRGMQQSGLHFHRRRLREQGSDTGFPLRQAPKQVI